MQGLKIWGCDLQGRRAHCNHKARVGGMGSWTCNSSDPGNFIYPYSFPFFEKACRQDVLHWSHTFQAPEIIQVSLWSILCLFAWTLLYFGTQNSPRDFAWFSCRSEFLTILHDPISISAAVILIWIPHYYLYGQDKQVFHHSHNFLEQPNIKSPPFYLLQRETHYKID